ncbi:MAG: hypothetical protein HYY06_03865 [Deltaproteobacteria bacterium]|nr:hypothetical protein [Deltaproteobacteria bacterium]
MAVEKIEAFLLGLMEDPRAEDHRDPKTVLFAQQVDSVERMVEIIESADLERIPETATCLRLWMQRARRASR